MESTPDAVKRKTGERGSCNGPGCSLWRNHAVLPRLSTETIMFWVNTWSKALSPFAENITRTAASMEVHHRTRHGRLAGPAGLEPCRYAVSPVAPQDISAPHRRSGAARRDGASGSD